MKLVVAWFTVLLVLALAIGDIAFGDVPLVISYQGRVTDAVGQPIDSTCDVTFYLFSDSLGIDKIWEETHTKVEIKDGLFTVLLGLVNTTFSSYFEGKPTWLGMQLAGGSLSYPLVPMASAGYAFKSARTDTASVAKKVVDNSITTAKIVDGTILFSDIGQNSATSGEVIKWNGSAWEAQADDAGSNTSGWTDGGTVVGLTTSADTVAVNTSLRLGRLNVGGDLGLTSSSHVYFGNDSTYIRGLTSNLHLECNTYYLDTRGHMLFGHPDDGYWVKFDNTNKRVGIGTVSVDERLHVENTTAGGTCWLKIQNSDASTFGQTGIKIQTPQNTWNLRMDMYTNENFPNGSLSLYSSDGLKEAMTWAQNGNVGVGTTDPGSHKLYVDGTSSGYTGSALYARTEHTSGVAANCYANSSYPTVVAYQKGTGDIFRGYAVDASDVSTAVARIKADGRVICPVLELTGGSDVAEPFEMTDGQVLPSGALVVIDADNPGRLRLADSPYDARVAGVVSGAGGVNPGITLSQKEVSEGGQNVAISGRVYCLADASYGPIKPGDLLTTSPTKGHAMVASDRNRAYGSVIGKAMSALDSGTGLVLILVSLQ